MGPDPRGTLDPSVHDILRHRRSRARRMGNETYAAVALAVATVVALVWANVGTSYETFWSTPAIVGVGDLALDLTLKDWVDEGLMALFFFMVGLDVRRELTLGELRHPGRAALPVAAALGGLLLPAGLFLLVTSGEEFASAWGAVISTDTAFALGMLALVGPRNAPRLRLFLLTLAVVDDVGALSVIAIFYTEDLNLLALAGAGLGLLIVWLLQRHGVWRVTPYLVLGVGTWVALYVAGVHATLAGVLLALLMPVYPPRGRDLAYASVFFHLFRQAPAADSAKIVRDALVHAVPVNQRLSSLLPPYVNFLVVPLFALANAGVALSGDALADAFTSTLTWGVVLGLVVGKVVGITVVSALVLRLLPSSRLPGLDLPRIVGAGALSGMGFTISLLVVGLALDDPLLQDQARVGVLTASLLALGLAWVVFRVGDRLAPLPTPAGQRLQREVDPARDHVRGPVDAPSTLVVYAAMDRAYRMRTSQAVTEARRIVGEDDVQVVFRHHTSTDEDITAALALEAAAASGRFWELHDALVHSRAEIDEELVSQLASDVGMDGDQLRQRIRRGEDLSRIEDDEVDASTAGLPDGPVLYVQGTRVNGPANSWHLSELLRAAVRD